MISKYVGDPKAAISFAAIRRSVGGGGVGVGEGDATPFPGQYTFIVLSS